MLPTAGAEPVTATTTAVEAGEAHTLDGLAAVLGGEKPLEPARIILQSDVELRARLLLLGRGSERALFGELPRSLLRATLAELIGEHLIAIEAERVRIAPPGAADVQRELEEIERQAGGHREVVRLLAWLEASRVELEVMAERRASIGAFLRANLEGVNVVTEAEVDARVRDDSARFAAETPMAARAAMRAALAKEALRRHIDHWVRVLRARTRVRIFAHYDSP